MKKFIFFAIIVAALFTTEHPIIKVKRDAWINEFVTFLSESSKVRYSYQAKEIKQTIQKKLALSPHERNYINENFSTDTKAQEFNFKYCKSDNINVYFHAERINLLCDIIDGASLSD